MLGAFTPFYRNHEAIGYLDHEFYRWPLVAEAARIAIKARYQLLDYIYTALHTQTVDGTPLLNPMFFKYPSDANTFSIQAQYFYGPDLLVSPVTVENATDVDIYLPKDQFYDFFTFEPVSGTGARTTLSDVAFTQIPVYIKGGAIIPIRVDGANTTTALRALDFNLIVAPSVNGTASGQLYLDDGVSIEQAAVSEIVFAYDGSVLSMDGTFDYPAGVQIANVILLGATPTTIAINKPLTGPFTVTLNPSSSSSSTATPTTLSTSTTASVIAPTCNHNNCLRAAIPSITAFTSFCGVYTAQATPTVTIPKYLANCNGVASKISSACSCLVTGS
jgi:alpha-glucosidase